MQQKKEKKNRKKFSIMRTRQFISKSVFQQHEKRNFGIFPPFLEVFQSPSKTKQRLINKPNDNHQPRKMY
jgi:hypothetical protein